MNLSLSEPTKLNYHCHESVNGSCVGTVYSAAIRLPLYVFFSLSIVLIVSGNLLVIIIVAYFEQLHKPTNYLILSLAVTDLFLGGFVLPLSMVKSLEKCWYFGNFFCKFHSGADLTLCNASVLHLTFISIERYYAICHPLKYQRKITTWVTVAMIISGWSLSAMFGFGITFSELNIQGTKFLNSRKADCKGGCATLHGKEIGVIYSIVFYFIPVIVIVRIYGKLFIIARKQARIIHSMKVAFQSQITEIGSASVIKMEVKATKTLATVIGVFLFCWTPFFMCNIIDPFIGHIIPPLLYEILMWTAYSNSMFNPMIYAFFNSWCKEIFQNLLKKRQRSVSSVVSSVST